MGRKAILRKIGNRQIYQIFWSGEQKNFHEFSKYIRGKWFIILYLRIKHYLNKNSRSGSKKNISFHYDLGNSFYEKWLDKSMTYSSAMFEKQTDDLFKAQINKYSNLAKITNIRKQR